MIKYYHKSGVLETVDIVPVIDLIYFRDVTNGYLVAEVFSWYFPQDIQMHSYNNGKSLDSKQRNWNLLNNVSFN